MILQRILTTVFLLIFAYLHVGETKKVVRCLGTNSQFSFAQDRMHHVTKLENRYRGCTIVQGNLEITGLEIQSMNASFLKDIEVVTGYVLIALNYIPYIPLEKLKIIRGQQLYGDDFALHVVVNFNRDVPGLGLRQLGFKSLTEIQRGGVEIVFNKKMCFADTINWLDILNPRTRKQFGYTVNVNNTDDGSPVPGCPKCHESCNGSCWGEGPDMCQTLTSSICHTSCGSARCRGPNRDDCCHRECACGCNGPTDRDCIACLHVNNAGVCQRSCPVQYFYDHRTSENIPNPYFKYRFNELCVSKCPDNMLVQENSCVKHCRRQHHNNGSGVCVPCVGNVCNKECFGVGNPDGPLNKSETIDSKNVHFFEGCNIVRGNVIFQAYAFRGDNHTNTPPMTAAQVRRAFSSVKIINGYLKILSWTRELEEFSVFGNLTTIRGIDLYDDVASLLIQDIIPGGGQSHMPHVKSLGFRSLANINYGNVYIGYMQGLCYLDQMNWAKIIKNPVDHGKFKDGYLLRDNKKDCSNATCDAACSGDGCWGPGKSDCLKCRSINYNGNCELECKKELGIHRHGDTCLACHLECNGTCKGAGAANCTSCKNFNDDGECVRVCPSTKFGDVKTKQCIICNDICFGQRPFDGTPLCSGPDDTLGQGGCEYCHTVIVDKNLRNQNCLPKRLNPCPPAYFVIVGLKGTHRACVPCYKGCIKCTGSSEKDCLQTQNVFQFLLRIFLPRFF